MMSYESRSTSCLFRVPIEIRRAIYADLVDIAGVHISLSSQGGVRLTRCLGPDLGAENSGDERRPRGNDPDDRIWARRVASTWGLHWECEETALAKDQKGHQDIHTTLRGSFLITCKRLYFELGDWMKEQVCYHFTDLTTPYVLLEPAVIFSERLSSSPVGFNVAVLPQVINLDITLSLPLIFQIF
ncbi:hypothetical protein PG987_005933 [Apiospora arundinis]